MQFTQYEFIAINNISYIWDKLSWPPAGSFTVNVLRWNFNLVWKQFLIAQFKIGYLEEHNTATNARLLKFSCWATPLYNYDPLISMKQTKMWHVALNIWRIWIQLIFLPLFLSISMKIIKSTNERLLKATYKNT